MIAVYYVRGLTYIFSITFHPYIASIIMTRIIIISIIIKKMKGNLYLALSCYSNHPVNTKVIILIPVGTCFLLLLFCVC